MRYLVFVAWFFAMPAAATTVTLRYDFTMTLSSVSNSHVVIESCNFSQPHCTPDYYASAISDRNYTRTTEAGIDLIQRQSGYFVNSVVGSEQQSHIEIENFNLDSAGYQSIDWDDFSCPACVGSGNRRASFDKNTGELSFYTTDLWSYILDGKIGLSGGSLSYMGEYWPHVHSTEHASFALTDVTLTISPDIPLPFAVVPLPASWLLLLTPLAAIVTRARISAAAVQSRA